MKPLEWISVIVLNFAIGVVVLPHVIWHCPTRAPRNETVALQNALCRHIATYYEDCGPMPALQSQNELLTSWRACAKGPYVRTQMLRDAWARPFLTERAATAHRLVSAGADQEFLTDDDLRTDCQSSAANRQAAR